MSPSPDLAAQALRLARTYNEYADALRDRARDLWERDKIDEDEYDKVRKLYDRMRGVSQTLSTKASTMAAQGIDAALDRLKAATDDLEKSRRKLDGIANVVGVAAKLVAATAAIAAMVTAPSPGTVLTAAVALEAVVTTVAG